MAATGELIDGRNRLAACELAQVAGVYTWLSKHDPVAFIWGANAKRRQTTKRQIAMVAAMGFTESSFNKLVEQPAKRN